MTEALWITGLGVAAAGVVGVPAFEAVLRADRPAIGLVAGPVATWGPLRCAALLPPAAFAFAGPRGATRAARSALLVAREAWAQARLTDPSGVALAVAGHNLSLAETAETLLAQQGRMSFAPPRHAVHVWDSHVLGVVAEALRLTGPGMLAGAHFASGLAALAQASLWLRAGEAEVALCVAPCAALSALEWHALANLGATAGLADDLPAYQPFAPGQAGFVPGEAAACAVLETAAHARSRGARPLAGLGAVRLVMAGRAGPEPDAATAARAMRAVLQAGGLAPAAIGYVNAHATGTPAGDAAEAAAIRAVFGDVAAGDADAAPLESGAGAALLECGASAARLKDGVDVALRERGAGVAPPEAGGAVPLAAGDAAPWVNATKAIAGHGLFAAGLVGLAATVLQVRSGFLHANPHLDAPPAGLRLVGRHSVPFTGKAGTGRAALCNAFGFDGLHGCALVTDGMEG